MVRRGVTTATVIGSNSSIINFVKEGFLSRASLTTLRNHFNTRLRRISRTSEPDTEPAATGAVGHATRLANAYADSIAVADSQN